MDPRPKVGKLLRLWIDGTVGSYSRRCRRLIVLGAVATVALLIGGCGGPKRLSPLTEPPPDPSPGTTQPVLLGVGIAEGQAALELTATGVCDIRDGHSGQKLGRLDPQKGPLVCAREGDQVTWRSAGLGGKAPAILLQPVDPDRRVVYDQRRYRGDFLILATPQSSSGVTLVNNVELEAYLRGVVPWEIGRHSKEKAAALEAQAVAARTYTMSHLGARKARGFDVFASVMDQVYKGSADEDPLCNTAIEKTAGLVLHFQGEEISAYYSACCGGQASRIEAVWARGAQPYLVNHPDKQGGQPQAFCADSRHFNWTASWTRARLEAILQETLPEYLAWVTQGVRARWAGPVFSPKQGGVDPNHPGRLYDLEIIDRTPSGRVGQLAITTEAGVYHVRADRTRWVLRPADGQPAILRSAFFDLDLEHDKQGLAQITAKGRGYGHGIGLCQTGALEMARLGYDYAAILAHYYPGAVLARAGVQDDQ